MPMTSPLLDRRDALALAAGALALAPAYAQAAPGPVLVLRHAQTEPGVGDPPGYRLDRCETQRNLSAEGRAQARAFGATLASRNLRPREIRSSRWCRCLDTGTAITRGLGGSAPAVGPWTPLDSFFDARERAAPQTAQLQQRLASLATGNGFELWVTHQVNISALTVSFTSMGQALWLVPRAGGALEARPFE
jgi:phosphohistidine phosphatase SixA